MVFPVIYNQRPLTLNSKTPRKVIVPLQLFQSHHPTASRKRIGRTWCWLSFDVSVTHSTKQNRTSGRKGKCVWSPGQNLILDDDEDDDDLPEPSNVLRELLSGAAWTGSECIIEAMFCWILTQLIQQLTEWWWIWMVKWEGMSVTSSRRYIYSVSGSVGLYICVYSR